MIRAIILVFVAVALFISGPAWAGAPRVGEVLRAQVETVHDGDTITARLRTLTNGWIVRRVRLGGGVDCPELSQPYGQEAAARTRALVKGRRVLVEVRGRSYGRLVGLVWVDGRSLGALLVAEGLAWVDERYAKGERGRELRESMARARAARLGLWGASVRPVSPREWRGTHE